MVVRPDLMSWLIFLQRRSWVTFRSNTIYKVMAYRVRENAMLHKVKPITASRIRQANGFLNTGANTLAPILRLINHRVDAVTLPAQK